MLSGELRGVALLLEQDASPARVAAAVRLLRALADEQGEMESAPVPTGLRPPPRPGFARPRKPSTPFGALVQPG